jgi:hypothetical protein
VINSCLQNNVCFALSLSLSVKKHCWSNIFSLTAQSVLGLTVARDHIMVVLSHGLSALRDEKDSGVQLCTSGWMA